MKVKMPADLASLLASIQDPQVGKGKGSGLGCNYVGDWWMSVAVPNLLDFSSVKDFISLSSALPPTSSSLHYQLTVILDGVKTLARYDSSAAFSMISWDLCDHAEFKVSSYKGGIEMVGGVANNFTGKLEEAKLTLNP